MADEDQPEGGALPLALLLRELLQANEGASAAMAARLGVGVTDVHALGHLAGDEAIGPVELGQRLGLRSASATALVDRLERAGHVERRRHPSDRRRVELVPTVSAMADVGAALRPLVEPIGAAEAELTPDERAAVERFLRAAIEAFRAYADDAASR